VIGWERTLADTIADYLLKGICVSLEGARGSGKSYILNAVERKIVNQGSQVLRISGLPGLIDRPMAAISAQVPELQDAKNTGTVVHKLTDMMEKDYRVLIVDHSDDLDTLSIGAILSARYKRDFPVAWAYRPTPFRVSERWHIQAAIDQAARFKTPRLTIEDVAELMASQLGAPVEMRAAVRATKLCDGLPGMVIGLTRTAKISGALKLAGGQYVLTGELEKVLPEHSLYQQIADLSQEELEAITKLALVGPVDVVQAMGIVGEDNLAHLEDRQLLSIVSDKAGNTVSVRPPLLQNFIVAKSGSARALLGNELHGLDIPRNEPKTSTQEYVEFETYLSRTVDSTKAHYEDEPTFINSVRYLEALCTLKADALPTILKVGQESLERLEGQERIWLLMWMSHFTGMQNRSIDAARDYVEAHTDSPDDPAYQALYAHLSFTLSEVPDPASYSKALEAPAPVGELGKYVRTESLLAAGECDSALKLVDGERPTFPPMSRNHDLAHLLGMLLQGHCEHAFAEAEDGFERAKRDYDVFAMQAYGYGLALCQYMCGRFNDMLDLSELLLSVSDANHLDVYWHRGVLNLAALSAKWLGRTSLARAIADQAKALSVDPGPYPMMLSSISPELIYLPDPEAADTIWKVAEERLEHGYLVAAITAAVMANYHGKNVKVTRKITDAIRGVESPLVAAEGRYLKACALDDLEGVRVCADELWSLGHHSLSIMAGVRFGLLANEQGEPTLANMSSRRLWQIGKHENIPIEGIIQPLLDTVKLSEREWDIANSVAANLSPSQIASDLNLSVRTVENHISKIYVKVGVRSRESLLEAMSTWLSLHPKVNKVE
jgi:DNA-binding CsgD family transcriptional regulator